MSRPTAAATGLFLLAIAQLLLFHAYFDREIADKLILSGDSNWYTYYAYALHEAVLRRDISRILDMAATSPWGMLLFLEGVLSQLLFGVSRHNLVVLNLLFFIAAQIATFATFRRITGSPWSGLAALLLLLAMRTPFRFDGPDLNIVDFHFDLILFYLLLLIFYLVIWSDTFAQRKLSLLIGVLAALTVASRLVSFFLLVGIFGALLLLLLFRRLKAARAAAPLEQRRLLNLVLAGAVFLGVCAPALLLASDALYGHYFRFLMDADVRTIRTPLYTMGASLPVEAVELLRRMIAFDFGRPFAPALVLFFLIAFLGRFAPDIGWPLVDAASPASRRLQIHFLLIAVVVSYGLHLLFPIKSDHLTRMTAAPLFVLVALLGAPAIGRIFAAAPGLLRLGAKAMGVALLLMAFAAQASFYIAKGRYESRLGDVAEIGQLYEDMSRIVHARRQSSVAISVDKVGAFELGPLLGYYIYEYEKNRKFLEFQPRLGAAIDEPVSFGAARGMIDQSDFVMLTEKGYPPETNWPLMRSVRPFQADLTAYVRDRYCFVGRYQMEDAVNVLYARPFRWKVTASHSLDPRYDARGLLGAGGVIWHTQVFPRGPDFTPPPPGPRFIIFQAPSETVLSRLQITAQSKHPTRAPRDFTLEALDAGGPVRSILTVNGADFSKEETQSWTISSAPAAKTYRLQITGNGGDPFLTIQDMYVELASFTCEQGQKLP